MPKTLLYGFWYQLSDNKYLGNVRILRVFGTSALPQKTNCGLQCCETCNFCPTDPLLVRVKAHLRLRLSIFGNFPNLGKVLIKGIHLFRRLLQSQHVAMHVKVLHLITVWVCFPWTSFTNILNVLQIHDLTWELSSIHNFQWTHWFMPEDVQI